MRLRVVAVSFAALLFSAASWAQVATTTSITISPNSVKEGSYATIAVKVTAVAGTPTGSVNISANGDVLLSIPLLGGSGSETVPANGFPAGTYTIVAAYPGNSPYSASSGSTTATILSPVNVSLQAVPNPVVSGQNAKLVATLAATDGGGTPTGTVKFYVGSEEIGAATASGGQAVLSAPTTGITPGTYPVVAAYQGDSLHAAANSATQNVTLQAPGGTACGTGSESMLNGLYAFSLDGYSSGSQTPYYIAGAFVANGSGSITGGEQDVNSYHSYQYSAISNVSAYSVGSDGRGCLTLVTSAGTHVYRFSLSNTGALTSGVAYLGRIIEFDDTNGAGTRATGAFEEVYTSQLGLSDLQATYSFGLGGFTGSSSLGRASLMGNFAISTSGVTSKGVSDSNYNSVTELNQTLSGGTLSSIDSDGRATLTFTTTGGTYHFAAYELNRDHFYLISTDASGDVPVLDGEMHYAASDFTTSTVWPQWVDHISGTTPNQSSYQQVLARTTFATNGTYSSTRYEYSSGSASTVTDSGTFTVSSNGRLVLNSSGGSTPQIYYMFYTSADSFAGLGAYELGLQSPLATSGSADQQEKLTYSDSTVAGPYNDGHDVMLEGTETNQSGEVTISSSGSLTGTLDKSSSAGLSPAVAVSNSDEFDFNGSGISDTDGVVGMATGSNVWVLTENGSLNPLLELTYADTTAQ